MEPPGIDWDCLPGGTQVTGVQKWESAALGGRGGSPGTLHVPVFLCKLSIARTFLPRALRGLTPF